MTAKTFLDYRIEIPSGATGEVDVVCPECSAQRKKKRARCLSVNVEKGTWTCHHCGWAGGLGKESRRNELHWRKPEYRRPDPRPQSTLPENVVAWFAKRGIGEDVLTANKIGHGPVYMPQLEDHTTAISFPYFRNGELVNVKYRDANKNFRMEAGAERILYGLDDIGEKTIIVEGEMDKLSLEQAGFTAVVSVPDGAPTPNSKDYSSKFSFLESAQEKLETVEIFVLAVDNDEPGQRLEDELSRRLGREKCLRVVWPEGCKDANDVLVKLGSAALVDCIRDAQPFPINGVFTVLDMSDRIQRLYENGWEKGVPAGWANIDKLYTVRPGEFTAVTGIPNSGKSNWLDALTVNLAKKQGWRIAFFSPENQPIEDHMARMIEKYAEIPFHDGPTRRIDKGSLEICKEWLHEHFFWILPDDDAEWTIDAVLEAAKGLVFRHGIRGLVIDPWNEMEHLRPQNMSETEYISHSLKRIRNFGRRYGVHVWVVAHPAKLHRDKDGNYPVPTMYDISGSAHWRNKADNGICVWRDLGDEQTRMVEIHVQKVRFRQIGKIGMGELVYSSLTGTYHEPQKARHEIPDASYL